MDPPGALSTLNEMRHLESSRYGRRRPRHGLKLLHWLAQDFLEFDDEDNLLAVSDPEDMYSGFESFENRWEHHERYGDHLLPHLNPGRGFQYYEVGNFHTSGAEHLPWSNSSDFTGRQDASNMDRIIISCDYPNIDRVYVTQHEGSGKFDQNHTYRISKGLIKLIQSMTLKDFLREAGYQSSRRRQR